MQSQYVGVFSDSGTQNSFYTLEGRKYGFKSFPTQELARFSHAIQSELAKNIFAPRVYSAVGRIRITQSVWVGTKKNGENIFRNDKVLSDWGYLTEIAKAYTCPDYYSDCDDHCAFSGYCRNNDKISYLMDGISELGIEYTDAHNGNLGIIRRGNRRHIVVIDVGRESIGEYDTDKYPYVEFPNEYSDYEHCSCSACKGSGY